MKINIKNNKDIYKQVSRCLKSGWGLADNREGGRSSGSSRLGDPKQTLTNRLARHVEISKGRLVLFFRSPVQCKAIFYRTRQYYSFETIKKFLRQKITVYLGLPFNSLAVMVEGWESYFREKKRTWRITERFKA